MGDVASGFERGDDRGDQVPRHGFGGVREDDVGVAAFELAASVASHDDGLKTVICQPPGVGLDRGRDGFDLSARHLELELVVVLDADLLHPCQRLPSMLDDVVEIAPVAIIVEFTSGGCTDAPYFIKEVEDFQCWVCVNFSDGFNVTSRGVPFMKKLGYFLIATWESENVPGAGERIRVCSDRGNTGAVGSNTNLVSSQHTRKLDFLELADEFLIGILKRSGTFTGVYLVLFDPVRHWQGFAFEICIML